MPSLASQWALVYKNDVVICVVITLNNDYSVMNFPIRWRWAMTF